MNKLLEGMHECMVKEEIVKSLKCHVRMGYHLRRKELENQFDKWCTCMPYCRVFIILRQNNKYMTINRPDGRRNGLIPKDPTPSSVSAAHGEVVLVEVRPRLLIYPNNNWFVLWGCECLLQFCDVRVLVTIICRKIENKPQRLTFTRWKICHTHECACNCESNKKHNKTSIFDDDIKSPR